MTLGIGAFEPLPELVKLCIAWKDGQGGATYPRAGPDGSKN
jgi:hypothetical protein